MLEREALEAGVRAVIYSLPLVMMNLTMRKATNVTSPRGVAAPVNQFGAMRAFPTAAFKDVVRANVDTLYSSAFLDVSSEPVVLSVPDTAGRYYLLPMFDAWTNVFATPGKRTTGTGPRTFAVTGPGWSGVLPPDVTELKSPTNTVWILGRTQTNGAADYPAVHAIQDGYTLVPLSNFGRPFVPPLGVVDPTIDMSLAPVERLQRMSAAEYFGLLAHLLHVNAPTASESHMLTALARIGIHPGQPFDLAALPAAVAKGLEQSLAAALTMLKGRAESHDATTNGWRIPPSSLGAFGSDFVLRGLIALIAFGANLPADAVYPTTFADVEGRPLRGAHRYTLRFAKGSLPPVEAFWSVTMYDEHSFFVDNAENRYAISSWMPPTEDDDGSITLRIQHDAPAPEHRANWLPAPEGLFNLTLRMYWPSEGPPSILDGSWTPPGVVRV